MPIRDPPDREVRDDVADHRAYSEFMKYQILPHLGAASIATLTSKHIARWRDDVAKDYAATTVNSALGCLSSAFSWFVAERWLAANPCDGVKQREVPDRAYKWIRTRGELERLLLASSEELCDMIAVSVATMLRIDELLHLQHDDIDLDARLITAQRAAGHHQEREGPPRADPGLIDSARCVSYDSDGLWFAERARVRRFSLAERYVMTLDLA